MPSKWCLTLISGSSLAVHAVGQVWTIAEHPSLTSRGLAGCWCPKRSIPACPGACELSRKVHGEGTKATMRILMGVSRRAPAGLLFNEGVWAQWAVGGASMKVQYRCPLRGTAYRQRAVPVPCWECWHRGQECIEVTNFWAHRCHLPQDVLNWNLRESESRVQNKAQVKSRRVSWLNSEGENKCCRHEHKWEKFLLAD